jgi:magnesium transporter
VITTHTFGTADQPLVWLDVVDTDEAELEELARHYGLEQRSFDDANRRAARPKLQRYDDHCYVVAFSGSLAEIDMYMGPTWLITVRRHDEAGREWDPQPAVDRFHRSCGATPSSGLLLAHILDDLIDGYFDATDVLEDSLEALEERIFSDADRAETSMQLQLFGLRRELLELRRAVVPLREVLTSILRREVQWFDDEALIVCRDAFDKLLRAIDLVDEQRELVGNAVDAHLAVMSNQMNLVMKQLTAWGSIVFGATLIAGIYGMNFRHMPELSWKLGYPMALGMMALMSALLYRVFRRRDWL